MKIGDKVRFVNEVGGGKVAGFQGKNIVLVEDADGFQIPMQLSDVVVVDDEDYSTTRIVENRIQHAPKVVDDDVKDEEPADKPVTFRAPVEERKGGDRLSAYLAFVPMDDRQLSTTRFESYLVNDSNYYLRYILLSAEGHAWMLRATGEVEPNTKLFIEEFGRENLNGLERLNVQLLAYKRDKSFLLKSPIDVQLRIDGVKFYKLHTFQENDFFEQHALIYPIIEQDKPARSLAADAKSLKDEWYRG